jgi:hypothetical protein
VTCVCQFWMDTKGVSFNVLVAEISLSTLPHDALYLNRVAPRNIHVT